jgi:ABC-type branched-subunit amino acid transport system substrate-binding protein
MKHLISVVIALLFLAAFPVAAEKKVTKLGFITILTGPYSDFGTASAKAAQLAIEDYMGKHPEEEIKLILEDDGADPKKGLSAFQKLRTVDHADLILPLSTFTIGSVRSIVNREKRLTLILGNEPYEPEDDYIYMLSPAAAPAEVAMGKRIAELHPQGRIVAFVSQNEAFFRFARAVKEGTGGRAELIEIPAGADIRAIVGKVRGMNPVAVMFNALPVEAAQIIKNMREIHFAPSLYFDDSVVTGLSDYQTTLGGLESLSKELVVTLSTRSDPKFVENFTKRFNTPPQLWTDYTYDLVALALSLRHKPVEEARSWLRTNVYHGVSGDIEFDAVGLRKPVYSIIPLGQHPGFKPTAAAKAEGK